MEIDTITAGAASRIDRAIREAARTTGASFEYLFTAARIESNLNPAAQATTSSAKGLYQFIEQTWLATLKQAGPALGLGKYSEAIAQGPDGRYAVPDPAARQAVMRLRSDPAASAMMAGVFTRSNAAKLTGAVGRAPSPGELYIAHFLGPEGAGKLITAAASSPRANAAAMFPAAAAANRSIFYDRLGRALGAGEVYAKLTGRYDVAHALAFSPAERAREAATVSAPPVVPPPPPPPAVDTAGVARAYAEAHAQEPVYKRPPGETRPLFQAMFTDVPRRGVSDTVNTLWASARREAQPSGEPSRLLDLFKDDGSGVEKLLRGGKV